MLCLITDEINFDYLVKVVSSLLHYETTGFPFMILVVLQGVILRLHVYCVLLAMSCLTLCDPMDIDCGLPVSSVHGISQARILEWVAISFSRGSS